MFVEVPPMTDTPQDGVEQRTAPDWATIRQMLEDDREAVHQLWSDCYAEPDWQWIDAATDGADESVTGFIAVGSRRIVGFAIVGVEGVETAEERHNVEIADHVEGDAVGWLRQLVVHPAARGNGIGTELTRARLWWLANHPEDPVHAAATCWVREDGPDARGVLERLGFEQTAYYEAPYEYDEPGECPDCESECTCDGATYVGEIASAAHEVVRHA